MKQNALDLTIEQWPVEPSVRLGQAGVLVCHRIRAEAIAELDRSNVALRHPLKARSCV
jgi:hypothetical protein